MATARPSLYRARRPGVIGRIAAANRVVPSPYIFYDGFEANNLDEWDSTTVESGNTLGTVSTGTPYAGTYHMAAVGGGTNDKAFASKGLSDLTEAWFSFVVKTASYGHTADFKKTVCLRAEDAGSALFQVVIEWWNGNGGRWRLYNHAGASVHDGAYTDIDDGNDYVVEVHWKAESGAAANDGVLEFWVDGGIPRYSSTAVTGTNGNAIDNIEVGVQEMFSGDIPASGATLYIDEFYVNDSRVTGGPPALLFEDDFETGDLSAWTGTTADSGNAVAAATGEANAGTYSLQSTFGGTNTQAYVEKSLSDITEFYAEFYMKVKNWDTTVDYNGAQVIGFYDGATRALGLELQTYEGGGVRPILIDNWTGGIYFGSFGDIADDTYVLLEFHWKRDSGGGDGEISFSIGGVEVYSITNESNTSAIEIDSVRIGGTGSGSGIPQSDAELYFDDVRLDDEALP